MKKKLFYFSILFLLTNCGHKQIKFSKDGYKCVLYYKNNPYTGLFIKYFDGKIRYISHLIDSVKTGSTIQYNENGTIQAYKEYSKAIKNGLFIDRKSVV